jgi:hypothetical protein
MFFQISSRSVLLSNIVMRNNSAVINGGAIAVYLYYHVMLFDTATFKSNLAGVDGVVQ